MKKFEDLEFDKLTDPFMSGVRSRMMFENGFGVSVVSHTYSYGGKDGLLWFCNNCNHLLYEVYFGLENIEKDFIKHFNFYNENKELHVCKNCGTKN